MFGQALMPLIKKLQEPHLGVSDMTAVRELGS